MLPQINPFTMALYELKTTSQYTCTPLTHTTPAGLDSYVTHWPKGSYRASQFNNHSAQMTDDKTVKLSLFQTCGPYKSKTVH